MGLLTWSNRRMTKFASEQNQETPWTTASGVNILSAVFDWPRSLLKSPPRPPMIRYLRFVGILSLVLFAPGALIPGAAMTGTGGSERAPLSETEDDSFTTCTSQRRSALCLSECRLSKPRVGSVCKHDSLRWRPADEFGRTFSDRAEQNARNGLGGPLLH